MQFSVVRSNQHLSVGGGLAQPGSSRGAAVSRTGGGGGSGSGRQLHYIEYASCLLQEMECHIDESGVVDLYVLLCQLLDRVCSDGVVIVRSRTLH